MSIDGVVGVVQNFEAFTFDAATCVGNDVIELHNVMTAGGAAVQSFADLGALITLNGGSTLIDFGGGNQITLFNVTPADLTADDFLFF